jgi:hypothetical protein
VHEPSTSEPATQVLGIIDSSEVLRRLVWNRPGLLTLFVQAAGIASARGDSSSLAIALARVAGAGKRIVDAVRSGDDVELAKWTAIADSADEELSRLLAQLCPSSFPIEGEVSSSPAPAPN